MTIVARLDDLPFDPAAELQALTLNANQAGAIVSFVGLARPLTSQGDVVDKLVLDHHPRLTRHSLEMIASEATERFDVGFVHVIHRCGAIAPGEPIVFVGAASAHRRAAFQAVDYLMDRLKTEAVFWKREEGPAGTRWIEPTDTDYADRGRWE